MDPQFRKAALSEIPLIWKILQQAVLRRKMDGSSQWQDGYPNPETVQRDIEKGAGYVLAQGDTIIGYCAVLINDEPAYAAIKGAWLSEGDFVVVHRVAVAEEFLGRGFAKMIFDFIEESALSRGIYSIRADTNFDNKAMLRIFEKSGYTYCGEVYFRGSARKAFEKVLMKNTDTHPPGIIISRINHYTIALFPKTKTRWNYTAGTAKAFPRKLLST